MFDKLILAVTNVVKDFQPAKKLILKVNLFTPLLVYLSRAMDMLDADELFTEERIMSCLNVLSQTTDGEKLSQDWILKNVKIDQICTKLLVQKQSLTIAG